MTNNLKQSSEIIIGNKRLISYSKINSFASCPFRYHLHYQRKIKPIKESVKFTFGKAIHEALAYYYSMKNSPDDAIEYFDAIWKEAVKNPEIDFGMKKVTKAMIKENPELENVEKVPIKASYYYEMGVDMLQSYFETYEGENLKIAAIEESFTTSFKNPKSNYTNRKWQLTGIIDLIVEDKDGYYEIWDHKTMAKTVGSATMELSHQISAYYLGAAEFLGVPITRIKKAVFNILYKTKGYPCERIETTRSEEQINRFLTQLNAVSKAMSEPKIFQNISFACAGCEYYDWCQGKKDGYYCDSMEDTKESYND